MKENVDIATRIRYARIAGFVYLLLIVLFMGGQFLISHVVGDGDLPQRLGRIATGQLPYRIGLVLQVLASVFTVLLAAALHEVLRPVNAGIARLALYFRLGEAFSGLGMASAFAVLSLQGKPEYLHAFGLTSMQAILDLARSADFASFNITTLFFSFGSSLFFYLFLQTRYIPRALSALGLFASIVVLPTSIANLLWPEHAALFQFGWAPIFLAEITTGLWLLVRGVRVEPLPASDAVAAIHAS